VLVTATAPRATVVRRVMAGRRVATRLVARRAVAAMASATAAVVLGSMVVPASAGAAGNFVSDVNAARGAAGLPPLAVSSDLAAAATRQANAMAQSATLFHTPNLSSAVCCWASLGENVGMGQSIASIHAAFMASPAHRDNILSSSYTQIGVGYAVDARGLLWVSEIFRRPNGTPAPAPRVIVRAPVTKAPVARVPVVSTRSQPTSPKVAAAKPAPPAPADLPVSRNFARLPIEVAQQSLAQFTMPDVVRGTNPVSRLLDFAAKAAAQNAAAPNSAAHN
jgi:hypothetical protein